MHTFHFILSKLIMIIIAGTRLQNETQVIEFFAAKEPEQQILNHRN